MEGDVELARQVVEFEVIEDELPELLRDRQRLDEFIRVHAARGIAGEVTDVVRARTARVQSNGLDAAEKLHSVLRLDQPQLEVRAGRDLRVTAGELVGDVGEFAELETVELAAGNPQPRHVGFLVRREEEQALPLEAEGGFLVGCLVGGGVLEQQRIGVERVQFALDAFLGNQVVEVGLRRRGGGIGQHIAESEAAIPQAGKETFEVGGLLAAELLAGNLGERQGGRAHGRRRMPSGRFGAVNWTRLTFRPEGPWAGSHG